MRIPEKGVVYRASKRGFLSNYLITAGIVLVMFLLSAKYGVDFEVSPSGTGQFLETMVHLVLAGVAVYMISEPFVDGLLRHYVVSGSEVARVEGVFRKSRHAIPYQSISEVTVRKGLLGMLLNYGTVEVEGVREASSGVVMRKVHNPDEVRRLIRSKIDSSKDKKAPRAARGAAQDENEDKETFSLE